MRFRFDHEAEAALKKLHQTVIFDQLLSVEYARGSDLNRVISSEGERQNEVKEEQTMHRKYLDHFLQKLNSWTNHLDFNQPPPVYFKYQYPPPTLQVLTNIAKVLASVPKFYTQVLHLMNKMNLPCPFSENFNVESDIIPSAFHDEILTSEKKISDEESEIESDEEARKEEDFVGMKRKISRPNKLVKKPKLMKPPTIQTFKPKSSIKTEDVFETAKPREMPKKIELKVSGDLKRLEEEKEEICGEGFEKVMPATQPVETNESTEKSEEVKTSITTEELAANRISSKDQHILPVFKNYQAGVPSCRLYIKNLAKTVTKEDLNYVYRRYFIPIEEEQGTMFDIQLLQEGRMKGQAFISLQSVDQAKLALNETNGYILKGKPMVVQYARSSKAK